jgi:RNA polymerase sigma factor (sigma-70 family)
MSSPTPPPEFFDLVQQGDRHATTDFVDRHGPIALALLRAKFTRMSEAEREELVQEILLDVIASLPKYDRAMPFKPWFLTITRRRALDFMERHSEEWVEGEHGHVPTHVSYDEATGPEGPEELKAQILVATATSAEPNSAAAAEECDPDEAPPQGSLEAQIDALRRWTATLSPEQQALLSHYTLGACWEEVAEQLARLGDPVRPAAARVRGHRLIARAKTEISL